MKKNAWWHLLNMLGGNDSACYFIWIDSRNGQMEQTVFFESWI